ncbi:MAG: Bax inhibitor-1/YccA family protein [Spirochaetales bacterium]
MFEKNYTLEAVQIRERSILRNVYIWMSLGLALTGIVAVGVGTNPRLVYALVSNPLLFFGLIIGQLGLVFYLSARIQSMSAGAATVSFATYAALNGITLSLIFLAYTGTSIASAFFITAGTFAAMSVYALTTKRDLSGLGHYLRMTLIGLIIASLVNMFLRSSGMEWMISVVGILLFVGLTAYDTQIIKGWNQQAAYTSDESIFIRISIIGALKLYLDFINLFLFFLRFMGRSRD